MALLAVSAEGILHRSPLDLWEADPRYTTLKTGLLGSGLWFSSIYLAGVFFTIINVISV